MLIRHVVRFVACGALFATSVVAQEVEHPAHNDVPILGRVNFRNSGNQAAQVPFQTGVAWLHNFKYQEAAAAFRDAQRVDSTLALAYWLEALTYSHVVWGMEDLWQSQVALGRLAPTTALRLDKAKTGRERAFGTAVEAFFSNATLAVRTRAYADALQLLATQDSTDLETFAFASHGALMAWYSASAADKPALAASSLALAMRVFNANPNHPGAVHYLIHSADMDPRSAGDLLVFARAYDKIAPDADHALHMPSHVYLPLGLWRDVTAANERAWAASRAEIAREHGSLADLSWHTLAWLQYAYLQEGRWSAARALIDTARTLLSGVDISTAKADARFATTELAFSYGMDTGDWTVWPRDSRGVLAILATATPTPRAWAVTMRNAYQAAVVAIYSDGDRTQARVATEQFRSIADTLPPGQQRGALERFSAHIAALVARADGDVERGIGMLRTVAGAEAASASTPPTAIPTYELLGEMLLRVRRPREAAVAYRAALDARPNRSGALLGLARSLSAAGDRAGADEAYKRLLDNWQRADPGVRSIAAVRNRP